MRPRINSPEYSNAAVGPPCRTITGAREMDHAPRIHALSPVTQAPLVD